VLLANSNNTGKAKRFAEFILLGYDICPEKQVTMKAISSLIGAKSQEAVETRMIKTTYKLARRIAVSIIGGTILLLGVIMIVTPGPALIFVPVGLTILGLEFAWARMWLRKLREKISAHSSRKRGERAEEHRERQTQGQ